QKTVLRGLGQSAWDLVVNSRVDCLCTVLVHLNLPVFRFLPCPKQRYVTSPFCLADVGTLWAGECTGQSKSPVVPVCGWWGHRLLKRNRHLLASPPFVALLNRLSLF
ncbi:unnamed protein product, partial [Ectocarpus sp. 12 AP-2014]